MPGDHLANPPMIVTDVATNTKYQQPPFTVYGELQPDHTVSQTPGDTTTKYINGGQGIQDIALIPNSTQDRKLLHGVAAIFRTFSPTSYGGTTDLRVFVHEQAGKLSGYATGWKEIPGASLGVGPGSFGFNTIDGRIFSQRQGEYCYALMYVSVDYGSGFVGYKFNRGEFNQVWFQESFYLSDFEPLFDITGEFFVSDDASPFIWHVAGSLRRLSDGNSTTQGSFMLGIVEDGSPSGSYKFLGDNYDGSPDSYNYGAYVSPGTGYHFTGKAAAFRQKYAIPAGQFGYGPFLVHPWRCGSYNPPEQWFYLLEFDIQGRVTGRMHIYRSTWLKGKYKRYDNPRPEAPLSYQTVIAYYTAYQVGYTIPVPGGAAAYNFHPDRGRSFEEMPITIDDDPAYNLGPGVAGGTRYPHLNPDGFAFEHDWFNQAHFVGTIGPFSNFLPYNPASTSAATYQNNGYGTRYEAGVGTIYNYSSMTDIKIIRDRKRRGVLHLVCTDGKSTWFSQSGDDGRSWSRATQAQGPHGLVPNQYDSTSIPGKFVTANVGIPTRLAVERLFEDASLMAISYNMSGTASQSDVIAAHQNVDQFAPGERAAFAVVDNIASGAGNAEQMGVLFKRGELVRQSWL